MNRYVQSVRRQYWRSTQQKRKENCKIFLSVPKCTFSCRKHQLAATTFGFTPAKLDRGSFAMWQNQICSNKAVTQCCFFVSIATKICSYKRADFRFGSLTPQFCIFVASFTLTDAETRDSLLPRRWYFRCHTASLLVLSVCRSVCLSLSKRFWVFSCCLSVVL